MTAVVCNLVSLLVIELSNADSRLRNTIFLLSNNCPAICYFTYRGDIISSTSRPRHLVGVNHYFAVWDIRRNICCIYLLCECNIFCRALSNGALVLILLILHRGGIWIFYQQHNSSAKNVWRSSRYLLIDFKCWHKAVLNYQLAFEWRPLILYRQNYVWFLCVLGDFCQGAKDLVGQ